MKREGLNDDILIEVLACFSRLSNFYNEDRQITEEKISYFILFPTTALFFKTLNIYFN